MRSVTLLVAVAAASAAAQSTGAWGGYVGGWREPGVSTGTWTGYVVGWRAPGGVYGGVPVAPIVRAPVVRPWVTAPVFVVPTPVNPPEEAARLDAALRAYAEAEATLQREENDRRLAEERQRAAEERERAAEERARLAEERQRAAELQRLADEALAARKALLEYQKAELARLAAAASPPQPAPPKDDAPGNEVYRWTDEDGVTHYSTRVPRELAGKAKLVGAKSKR
jgi:hypothetical protein